MNKMFRRLMAVSLLSLLPLSAAKAFDVPAYIKDPQDVSGNIDIIIKENTAPRTSSKNAQELRQKLDDTINEYAARLYAEAFVISAAASAEAAGDSSLAGKAGDLVGGLMGSTDKNQVLQDNVKEPAKEIAESVKQLMELEAAIANLEGLQILSRLDVSYDSEAEEEK